jgi:hypothetical protein
MGEEFGAAITSAWRIGTVAHRVEQRQTDQLQSRSGLRQRFGLR